MSFSSAKAPLSVGVSMRRTLVRLSDGPELPAGQELGDVVVAAGAAAAVVAPALAAARRLVELRRQARVREAHVAEEEFGVGAQRVRELVQLVAELGALGEDVAGDRAGVADEAAGLVLGRAADLGGRRLGVLADLCCLLLGGGAHLRRRRLELQALGAGLVEDPLRVLLRGGPQRGGFLARRREDLARLGLGRLDAVVGRP